MKCYITWYNYVYLRGTVIVTTLIALGFVIVGWWKTFKHCSTNFQLS